MRHAGRDPLDDALDRLRLIAGGAQIGDDAERGHPGSLGRRSDIAPRATHGGGGTVRPSRNRRTGSRRSSPTRTGYEAQMR